VPGGAGRERVLLEYDDVGDVATGEVIGDAATDDPTTDDDDVRTIRNA